MATPRLEAEAAYVRRGQQAHDGTGGAHGNHRRRIDRERQERPAHRPDQEQREKPRPADERLEHVTGHVQRDAVQQQMDRVSVEESGGQQAIPLPRLKDEIGIQAAQRDERPDPGFEEARPRLDTVHQLAGEDRGEQGEQRTGHQGKAGLSRKGVRGTLHLRLALAGLAQQPLDEAAADEKPVEGRVGPDRRRRGIDGPSEDKGLRENAAALEGLQPSAIRARAGLRPDFHDLDRDRKLGAAHFPGVLEAALSDLLDCVPREAELLAGVRLAIDDAEDLEPHAVRERQYDVGRGHERLRFGHRAGGEALLRHVLLGQIRRERLPGAAFRFHCSLL